ncbi:MAG: family 20 glycosylhydrolase [Clostridia bacterium]|nr:family 20 glycosylhydrolase [Clostridia bacterium]
MFLPRVKQENVSKAQMPLEFPLKVWCNDRPSRDLLPALHEMMPYGEFVRSTREEATLSLCVVSGISPSSEYYEISVKDGKIEIRAKDYRGLVNAAATLTQAIVVKGDRFYVPEMKIADYPDSRFRSVMLDPARHVIPMDEVRSIILGMAKSKYNKLHVHLSDAEGFSYLSDVYDLPPSPGILYTKGDLREIVAYAATFGIDVIPEIDVPAHGFSLTKKFDHLKCHSEEEENGGEPLSGWNICIGNDDSYTFIRNVLSELCEIFPYEYIHVGTDEISMEDIKKEPRWISCTCQCKVCNARFLPMGYETLLPRYYYFVNRVYDIVHDLGKKMMMWNDQVDISVDPPIPHDILIEFWRVAGSRRGPVEGCSMQRFLEEGFEVINADYPNAYIDLYMKWKHLKDWNLFADPADASPYAYRVLGGETCAWEGNNYPHYRHALYFAFPTFGDRLWNTATPLYDGRETMLALTRACLGCDVPEDLDLFSYLNGVPLGDAQKMEGAIFSQDADREGLRAALQALRYQTVNEQHLKNDLLSLL